MSGYIFPCKTEGKCQQLMFESYGWDWSDKNPSHGSINIITSKEPHNVPQWRGKYKCCTKCHLPLNQAEARKANEILGHKLEDVKIDDDFLELLNGL